MLVRKTEEIIKLTAEVLELDYTMVNACVMYHHWWMLKVLNEIKYATILIPSFGVFYLSKSNYFQLLNRLIATLRSGKNRPFVSKIFNVLFSRRHKVREYNEMRKTCSSSTSIKKVK